MRALAILFLIFGLYMLVGAALGIGYLALAGHGHKWGAYLPTLLGGLLLTGVSGLIWAVVPASPPQPKPPTLGELMQAQPEVRANAARNKPPSTPSEPSAPVTVAAASATSASNPVAVILLVVAAWFGLQIASPLLSMLGMPSQVLSVLHLVVFLGPIIVVVIILIRRARASSVPLDRHFFSFAMSQTLRYGIALGIVLLFSGVGMFLLPVLSRDLAMVLLATGLPGLIWMAGILVGLFFAWLFLRVTPVSRNRTIGEIARENLAKESTSAGS